MIDLHCHTSISDCSFTIEEVIMTARQKGIEHLAITDHDTTLGLSVAIEVGEALGVNIIPGIEMSAYDYKRNRRAHILGLYVTPNHPAIHKLCQPLVEKRHQLSKLMVEKIMTAGYNITWELVQQYAEGGTGVYKQHIMHALIDKGYTDRIYSTLYKELFSRGSETEKPGIAFMPIEYLRAEDAIRTIREAGGVPVLAHPGQFDNFAAVEEWVKVGLEGIEVHHPLHSEKDEHKAKELAERFRLIQTGGSDFHGFYSDTQSTIGQFPTKEEEFQKLLERKGSIHMLEERM
jgi:phosphoribosyl 1,2-cyclic phosphate 1,2-diphosphodiesterase